MISADRAWQ